MIGLRNAPEGRVATIATCVVLALAHLVLAPHVRVFGATPGFLLVLTACLAYRDGARLGTLAGFLLGLAFDLTGSGPVGLSSLLGAIAGFTLGSARAGLLAEGWHVPTLLFGACALAYNALYVALLAMFGADIDLGWALAGRIVVGTALDTLVGLVAFFVLNRTSGSRGRASGGIRLD